MATYSGTREVRTFVDLDHGANVLLLKASEDERGSYYTVMGGLLLTAFTFEAYLNHLGNKIFPYWEEIEAIRVMDKYSVLTKHFRIAPDFSRRPHQTLRSLFKFRNAIAHGKSQVLNETKQVAANADPHDFLPRADWEEYCTLANAKRAREDVRKIIEELHLAAGEGDCPFIHGVGIGSLSLGPEA
jgi:hypothetical protein